MRGLWFVFLLFVLTGVVAGLVIWRFGSRRAPTMVSPEERLFDDRSTVKLQAEVQGLKSDEEKKPSSLNLAPRLSQDNPPTESR